MCPALGYVRATAKSVGVAAGGPPKPRSAVLGGPYHKAQPLLPTLTQMLVNIRAAVSHHDSASRRQRGTDCAQAAGPQDGRARPPLPGPTATVQVRFLGHRPHLTHVELLIEQS